MVCLHFLGNFLPMVKIAFRLTQTMLDRARCRDRRQRKRYMNYMIKRLHFGMYAVDCRYHPCIITELDLQCEDISVKSVLDGTPCGCSIFHCGPLPITQTEAFERRDFIRSDGWDAYLKKYEGYTDAALEEFHKMDAVWNFNKGDKGADKAPE